MHGQAITYRWGKLNVFLQDGRIEIHNNRSERSIKPVVLGRKNFLFSNTPREPRQVRSTVSWKRRRRML
ncbi:transposase [Paenibacillus allorhizosphaerae]|uniref:IS66 family transposase n=1 Tax=Paenibacillus allorhizosphaerae TaxID=2849866 RepID=UPI001E41A038|nr:IS66 family transposase [Paenibacillus allorhizosphaerae]